MAMSHRRVGGLVLIAAAAVVAGLGAAPQEEPKQPTEPKAVSHKNVVVVRGCLAGSMLTDAEAREYATYVPDRMRTTGNRAMRAQIHELNGHYVEMTGAMKGNTSAATGAMVKDTGKWKVYVGGADRHINDPAAQDERLNPPQLDVTRVTDIPAQCNAVDKS